MCNEFNSQMNYAQIHCFTVWLFVHRTHANDINCNDSASQASKKKEMN